MEAGDNWRLTYFQGLKDSFKHSQFDCFPIFLYFLMLISLDESAND